MKKTTWIVKAYTGYKTGWQEIKRYHDEENHLDCKSLHRIQDRLAGNQTLR